ncbi:extensin [Drosophila teissieri]|uniref:extensin n=1 Tax=Drosophila teissieri TaxID=7243 RepID=UPI001CBA3F42|nr:extensin [Drosophila teissieri]
MWKWMVNIILLSVVQANEKVDGQIPPTATPQKIFLPYPCYSPVSNYIPQHSQNYPNPGFLCYPQNEFSKYLWYPPWGQWVSQVYPTGNGVPVPYPELQTPPVQLLTLPAPPTFPIPFHQYPGWSSPGASIPSYPHPGLQQPPGSSPPQGWGSAQHPGIQGPPGSSPLGPPYPLNQSPGSSATPGWIQPGSPFPPSPLSGQPGTSDLNTWGSENRAVHPPAHPVPPGWSSPGSSISSRQHPALQGTPLGTLGPALLGQRPGSVSVNSTLQSIPPSWNWSGSLGAPVQPPEFPPQQTWSPSGPNSPLQPPGWPIQPPRLPAQPSWNVGWRAPVNGNNPKSDHKNATNEKPK